MDMFSPVKSPCKVAAMYKCCIVVIALPNKASTQLYFRLRSYKAV